MNTLSTILISSAVGALASTVTTAAVFVELQATTPGTPQAGNLNVSGTGVLGKIRVGNTLAGGAKVRVEDTTASGAYYGKSSGTALYAESTGATGQLLGGYFVAASNGGRAIYADETATSGSTRGGLFQSRSASGVGCYGLSSSPTGNGIGVFGAATASTGTGVVAVNPNGGQRVELAGPNGSVYSGFGTFTKNYGGGVRGAAPLAYGVIGPSAQIEGGSGNFTVVRLQKGLYEITVPGEAMDMNTYPALCSTYISYRSDIDFSSGKLDLYTYDGAGVAQDFYVNFVIYKAVPGAHYPTPPDKGFKDTFDWMSARPAEYAKYRQACRNAEAEAMVDGSFTEAGPK